MATHQTLKKNAQRFLSIRSLQQLASVLQIPSSKISLQSLHPRYKIYTIKKANGKSRLIEDPEPALKKTLRAINENLQACYYTLRPNPVHGFCISNDLEEDRNIISNASQHIGSPWLLNIDFKDFFHTILEQRVQGIYRFHFPRFSKELVETLTKLTCFNYRLPMGSPTSPVLSNYAALKLDEDLSAFCKTSGMTYTRFADDCSFSAQDKIDSKTIQIIRDTIVRHRFLINEEKVKLFSPTDTKLVTGIVVGNKKLCLPEDYQKKLFDEILRFQNTMSVEHRYQTGMSFKKLKLFEQELRGKLNFAKMVEGNTDWLMGMTEQLEAALNPPDDFESGNWLEIPYQFF